MSRTIATERPSTQVPVGHRGLRGAILLQIKQRGRATAGELATEFGFSLNAVRHHLRELEHDGVVTYARARHGVGAPAHAYELSACGHSLFPDRHEPVLRAALDTVEACCGREVAVELASSPVRDLAATLEQAIAAAPAEQQRGELVAQLLDRAGYMAVWTATDNGGVLTEHHCPHRVLAERFPEVCAAEEALLSKVFGAPVARQSRIAGGCGSCTYHVHAPPTQEEQHEQ